MYQSFYQLTQPPFRNTPEQAMFFASEQHQEALAAAQYAVAQQAGVVLITGGLGTGKTTVAHTLAQQLGEAVTVVRPTPALHRGDELLRQVLRAVGVKMSRHDDRARLVERVTAAAIDLADRHRPLVVIADEAQTHGDGVLDELRLLADLDRDGQRLVQVVLVASLPILARLDKPRHAALRQRVAMVRTLAALDPRHTDLYIKHRLAQASADAKDVKVSFRGDAVVEVYRYSGGVPRLINTVCDHALLLAMVKQQTVVTALLVKVVLSEMSPPTVHVDSDALDKLAPVAAQMARSK